ncbi:hypothetical protein ACWEP4_32670 [Streptomyces sp. NPDC004227]
MGHQRPGGHRREARGRPRPAAEAARWLPGRPWSLPAAAPAPEREAAPTADAWNLTLAADDPTDTTAQAEPAPADDELETYRDLGILCDRDAGGAFRHCYTETVSRVFFVLVQRDPGYGGYGVADAPVWLAAQHTQRPAR